MIQRSIAVLLMVLCGMACNETAVTSIIGNSCEVNIAANDDIETRQFSVHTRPIDCEENPEESNSVCVTISDPPSDENLNAVVQSFCSCRCIDAYGQSHDEDESLCICPADTVCHEFARQNDTEAPIDELVKDILGAYCVPKRFFDN